MMWRPKTAVVFAVVAVGLSVAPPPGFADDADAGDSETAAADPSTSSAGPDGPASSDGIPTQLRSLRFGLGTGVMAGIDVYSDLGRFKFDVYYAPTLEGALNRECWRPTRTCRRRTHAQLTWGRTLVTKWLQGGFDVGLAGGHLSIQERVTWVGPAFGPLVGAHGTVTLSETFGIGAQLGAAPVYWARRTTGDPGEFVPNRVRFWFSGALTFQLGSVRGPAW